MQSYDPNLPVLRQLLALSILDKLDKCGFIRIETHGVGVKNGGVDWKRHPELMEQVYARDVTDDGRVKVKVFTTVCGGTSDVPLEVRRNGKDALRVCATYITNDGKERGLLKETRVNRTGDIDEIVERMYRRMRSAWQGAKTGEKCHSCGAPKFVAKSGKNVCAEICWQTDREKRANEIAYKSRNRRSTRRRRR